MPIRNPSLDIPLQHKQQHGVEDGSSVVQAALHRHGGDPEQGGGNLPERDVTLPQLILLDWPEENSWPVDVGGNPEAPDT